MKPKDTTIKILLSLYGENSHFMCMSGFLSKVPKEDVQDALTDLQRCIELGYVFPSAEDRYLFSHKFNQEQVIPARSKSVAAEVAGTAQEEELDQSMFVTNFTSITVRPDPKDNKLMLYELRHHTALNPAAASGLLKELMKDYPVWDTILLLPGTHNGLNPASDKPVLENFMWIEANGEGEVANIYYDNQDIHFTWNGIPWNLITAFEDMSELMEEAPDLYDRLVEFNSWCKATGHEHLYGTDIIDKCIKHPKLKFDRQLLEIEPFYPGQDDDDETAAWEANAESAEQALEMARALAAANFMD